MQDKVRDHQNRIKQGKKELKIPFNNGQPVGKFSLRLSRGQQVFL